MRRPLGHTHSALARKLTSQMWSQNFGPAGITFVIEVQIIPCEQAGIRLAILVQQGIKNLVKKNDALVIFCIGIKEAVRPALGVNDFQPFWTGLQGKNDKLALGQTLEDAVAKFSIIYHHLFRRLLLPNVVATAKDHNYGRLIPEHCLLQVMVAIGKL